jgi:hypothetical protein
LLPIGEHQFASARYGASTLGKEHTNSGRVSDSINRSGDADATLLALPFQGPQRAPVLEAVYHSLYEFHVDLSI